MTETRACRPYTSDEPTIEARRSSELTRLHDAVLRAESGAADAMAVTLVPIVMRRLRCVFSSTSDDMLRDAAHDAVLGYLGRPHRYDHRRSRLDVYVARCAGWRVRNLKRRHRYSERHERLADQEALAEASIAEDLRRSVDERRRDELRDRLLSLTRSAEEQDVLRRLIADPDAAESSRLMCERLRSRARRRRAAIPCGAR